jgi:hypothetical protein
MEVQTSMSRNDSRLTRAALAVLLLGMAILFIDQPWSRAQEQASGGSTTQLLDSGGTNKASISAGGALKVDGSAVTQPVSMTSTTITGTVAATESGTWTVQPGNVANTTAWKVDGSAVTQPVSGTVTVNALPGGTNSIGIVRAAPAGCTQSTNFTSSTVGVAISAGTSVTSTTTCVAMVYVNNTTNSSVTFRLQDKAGTPVIWIGGNADFSIPANSNVMFPLGGVVFTSGITAIAGTASALNLQVDGLQ